MSSVHRSRSEPMIPASGHSTSGWWSSSNSLGRNALLAARAWGGAGRSRYPGPAMVPPPASMETRPELSIVIPTKNRPGTALEAVQSCLLTSARPRGDRPGLQRRARSRVFAARARERRTRPLRPLRPAALDDGELERSDGAGPRRIRHRDRRRRRRDRGPARGDALGARPRDRLAGLLPFPVFLAGFSRVVSRVSSSSIAAAARCTGSTPHRSWCAPRAPRASW